MSTALATRNKQLTPDAWTMIERVAPAFKDARLFGVATEAQAMAIMAKGYELGLPITAAFEFIQVVQDKPTLSPRGALALIQQSGELESIQIEDLKDNKGNPTACRVTMKRKNGLEYTSEFSVEDAKRAGLVKPGGAWETYPGNLCRWRAVGFCADVVFPDVIGGMKRADEFGAMVDESGDVVEGQWQTDTSPPQAVDNSGDNSQSATSDNGTETKALEDVSNVLNDLVEAHSAEAVLVANEGKIPGSIEELEAVRVKLEAGDEDE